MATDSLTDVSDARIEVADVKNGGFSTSLDDEAIKEHIALAHEFIEDCLGGKMSDERLARIELYMARHSIKFTMERQAKTTTVGSTSTTYTGAFDGTELGATAPGQQAMMLDKTDTLGRQTLGFFSI